VLYNCSYTGVTFVRDNYGPYSVEITKELNNLSESGLISITAEPNLCDGVTYYHHQKNKVQVCLKPEAEKIAKELVLRTQRLNLAELKAISYATPPMQHILNREKKVGFKLIGEVIDMSLGKKGAKKIPIKKLREAFKTINFERRGTDEEYARTIFEEAESLRGFRERASKCRI